MEETIIEYQLVVNGDYGQLTAQINSLLNKNEGWKPLGGIAVTAKGDDQSAIFAQAMVKIGQGA